MKKENGSMKKSGSGSTKRTLFEGYQPIKTTTKIGTPPSGGSNVGKPIKKTDSK